MENRLPPAIRGNITVQAGWQWRGVTSDHLWRMGFQYYSGKTSRYVLGLRDEELYGFGKWFDYSTKSTNLLN